MIMYPVCLFVQQHLQACVTWSLLPHEMEMLGTVEQLVPNEVPIVSSPPLWGGLGGNCKMPSISLPRDSLTYRYPIRLGADDRILSLQAGSSLF